MGQMTEKPLEQAARVVNASRGGSVPKKLARTRSDPKKPLEQAARVVNAEKSCLPDIYK